MKLFKVSQGNHRHLLDNLLWIVSLIAINKLERNYLTHMNDLDLDLKYEQTSARSGNESVLGLA